MRHFPVCRKRCCECGLPGSQLIPYAKRGLRLVFVCKSCYYLFSYHRYFFESLVKA